MSEFDPTENPPTEEEPRGLRKQIEEQASKAREAEARAAAAERELAFAKAGLPLDDPKMGYFVKGYEGDLTPEAIKAAAESAGFLSPPAPEIPAEELAQHQQAANLAGTGQPAGGWTGAVHDNPQYRAEIFQARSPEEAMAVMAKYGSPILEEFD